MRRGFPKTLSGREAWISVGSVNHGIHGTSAVLIAEAPFPDGSGIEQLVRAEFDRDEAVQLAEWLISAARPKAYA